MAGTWRNRLSDEEIDALDTLRMKTSIAAAFRNNTMILMSDAGRSKASIAKDDNDTRQAVATGCHLGGLLVSLPVNPPSEPFALALEHLGVAR